MDGERYAVVSCHVERLLDDDVWSAFASFQASRPGGFRIAPLVRPPAEAEDADTWLRRARALAEHGALGHHTHFGGVTVARPAEPSRAPALVRAEAEWLRACGLTARFWCGGGWYADEAVLREVAAAGYADCSAVAFPLPWLGAGDPHLRAAAPCRLVLPDGAEVLELPTTHSTGSLLRSLARLPRGLVHVHFHDWELVDRRRRVALGLALRLLARRATTLDLAEAAERHASAERRPLHDVLEE